MVNRSNFTKSLLLLLFISISFSQFSFSQEVPGGVGAADDVNLWLRAEDNILNNSDNPASDGEEIKTWTGISGNTFSASKGTNGPLYTADGGVDFNNLPVIEFDNSNRYLSILDDDELDGDFSGLSIFVIYKRGSTDTRALLMKRSGYNSNQSYGIFYNSGFSTFGYLDNNSVGGSGTIAASGAHISSYVFNGNLGSSERLQLSLDGGSIISQTISVGDIPNYSSDLTIGKFDAGDSRYLDGDQIAEIFMIKSGLNDAQRVIVENYFEAKYPGITLTNDYFTSNPTGYYYDLIGVGQFNSDEHTESAAAGLVLSFYDGTLDTDGEFVMAAHDNTTNTTVETNLGAGVEERWSRTWHIEKTTAGTLNATVSFDLGDGIGGQYPQNKSDYVLLKYNSGTGDYEDVGIADANKNVSGDRMVFNVTDAELVDGIYTLGTTDKTNSPVVGSPNKTWYSYQSGNWNDPTTWTLDGAAAPLYVNPSNETPSAIDIVYVTNGRTVTIQNTTNNLTVGGLDVVGKLDLTSSTGHDFTTISGDGVISMEGNSGIDNYPAGDNTGFADAENGGKLIIYGSGISLDQARSFNEIEIEMDNSSDIVTQLADYTINGDIRIIKGIWQINDNASTTDLDITINGDLTIESLAEINVGTANARHQLNLYADFDNDGGRVEFTNRVAANYATEATDGIVDVNFLADDINQTITLKGITNFYRIEIDKGTDDTYQLDIVSGDPSFFNLFGYAAEGHGSTAQLTENNNAIGLIRGTFIVGENISIPDLSVANNYNISEGAKLWIDGGSVTLDENNAIVPYGKILVSSGTLTVDVEHGITTRDQGTFEITGGTTNMRIFKTSVQGSSNVGGYIQRGGTVNITGGTIPENYAVFSLTYEENIFIMEGGSLNISGQPALSTPSAPSNEAHGGLVFINSNLGNYNVTGGTITLTTDNDREFLVSSRAPFYDLVINNTSNGTNAKIKLAEITSGDNDQTGGIDDWVTLAAQELVVLNDLTLESGTTRSSSVTLASSSTVPGQIAGVDYSITSGGTSVNQVWGAYLDLDGTDLTVGGGLTINDYTVLDVWNWDGSDNDASSTLTFNGTSDATFYIGDITTYTNELVEFKDAGTSNVTSFQGTTDRFQRWELPLYNLTIDKEGASLFLASKDPGYGEVFSGRQINQYRFIDDVEDNDIDTTKPFGKNVSSYASSILIVENDFNLLDGTFSQVDPTSGRTDENDTYCYGMTLNGDISVNGTLFEFIEGVTSKDAKISIKADQLTTTDESIIGNITMRNSGGTVSITSDLYIKRLEFRFGILDIATNNLKVDVLDLNPWGSVPAASNGERVMDASNMIKMAGNQSDGGLSLKVNRTVDNDYYQFESVNEEYNNTNWLWYPIGTGANSSDRYTPAVCYLKNMGTIDGDEYITVRVVDKELQTTDLASGDDILSYYWNTSFEGYNGGEEPTISWLFQYDENDIDGGDETTYVPGKVLSSGTYERSTDGGTTDVKDLRDGGNTDETGNFMGDNPGNILIFNADGGDDIEDDDSTFDKKIFDGDTLNTDWITIFPGTGFTLEEANYTAGGPNRFDGEPDQFRSRGSDRNWNATNAWQKSTNGGVSWSNTSDYPQDGDIATIRNGHQIFGNIQVSIASLILDASSGRSKLMINDPASDGYDSDYGIIEAVATGGSPSNPSLEFFVDGTWNGSNNFPEGDYGNYVTFVNSDGDYPEITINFDWNDTDGTAIMPNTITTFPDLRLQSENENRNNAIEGETEFGTQIIQLPSADFEVLNKMRLQDGVIVRFSDAVAGDATIHWLNLDKDEASRLQFQGTGNPRTITIDSLLEFENDDPKSPNEGDDQYIEVVDAASGSLEHRLIVNGGIYFNGGGVLDLYSGDESYTNVILELQGSNNDSLYYSDHGASYHVPDLYQVVMNKDVNVTFEFQQDFTLNHSTNGSEKAIELQSGTLVLNHTDIDVNLTTGGDDFNIPQGSGLEVENGTVRASGSGIYLDGLLHINGGTADFDDADTYVEYSASGNAILDIDAGSLTIGNQLRRGLGSDDGVLIYRQSGGTVIIGNQAISESSRAVFEIVNSGSEFTHTGGDFTIVRQNGSNPSIAAFYLQPDTYDVTGSSITLGNASTPTGQNDFGINSTIALNNLIINGDNAPTINMTVNPLTINGDLIIENDGGDLGSLDANGLTLTVNGDFTNNGVFIPNGNTTIFSGSAAQLLSGSGTSDFYNFEKTNSETLTIGMDITINNYLDIDNGTFHTDIYSADVKGNVINDGLHTSTSGSGIIFSGTSQQQLLRSSIGTSIFGIVTINNTQGVEIPDGNGYFFTISDNLRLQQGVLNIGNSLLTIDTNAGIEEVNTFSSTNMIQTNSSFTDYGVQKIFPAIASATTFVFPVGESKYTPITFDITSSSAGSITIRPANEIHPSILEDDEFTLSGGSDPDIVDADNALQYHWILRGSGLTGFNATATFEYDSDDTEVTAPYSLSNYIPARLLSSGTTWDKAYSQADFDEGNLEIVFPFTNADDDGITGEYTAGVGVDNSDAAIFGAIPDDVPEYETNQSGGGDYDNGASWNVSIPADGPLGAIITVKSGDVLTINNNSIRLLKTIIEDGGVLEIDGTIGHRLGTVEGTGTIRIVSNTSSAVLPAGYYGDFFTCGGGALEYDGSGSYNVLSGVNNLENLTFSGSGTRTLPNNDINICNDIVMNGSVVVDNTSDRNINIQNDFTLNQTSEFITGSANVNLQGDLTLASGAIFNSSTGNNFTLDGTSDQNLTGNFSGYQLSEFYDLTINNSGGKILVNDGDTIEVDRTLNLTNGIISLGTTGIMVMDTLGTYTGGSSSSFIDGYFAKENLSTAFTFPVGYQTSYNPISVTSPTSGYWETRFRMEDPTTVGIIDNLDPDPSLLGTYPNFEVPGHEYWELTGPTPGTSSVEIGWNQYSNVSDYTQLFEMQWDDANSHWDAISNNGAATGSNTAGTIMSSSAVSFSTQYFTLGSGTIVILPVELVSFSGKKVDDVVELSWQTIVEQNTDFFEIERSKDGVNFNKIGDALAKGNSDQLNNYYFDDLNPISGINYYRLKMVDKDGNFEYSNVISVNVINENQGVLAYPNPVINHKINLSLWGFQQQSKIGIKVMDMLGKTVYTQIYESNEGGNFQIELELPSHLQTGIYQLMINDGNKSFNQKILIE